MFERPTTTTRKLQCVFRNLLLTPQTVKLRLEVTDVTIPDFRCYDSATNGTATTIDVAAGSQLGIMSDGTIYHAGVSMLTIYWC